MQCKHPESSTLLLFSKQSANTRTAVKMSSFISKLLRPQRRTSQNSPANTSAWMKLDHNNNNNIRQAVAAAKRIDLWFTVQTLQETTTEYWQMCLCSLMKYKEATLCTYTAGHCLSFREVLRIQAIIDCHCTTGIHGEGEVCTVIKYTSFCRFSK